MRSLSEEEEERGVLVDDVVDVGDVVDVADGGDEVTLPLIAATMSATTPPHAAPLGGPFVPCFSPWAPTMTSLQDDNALHSTMNWAGCCDCNCSEREEDAGAGDDNDDDDDNDEDDESAPPSLATLGVVGGGWTLVLVALGVVNMGSAAHSMEKPDEGGWYTEDDDDDDVDNEDDADEEEQGEAGALFLSLPIAAFALASPLAAAVSLLARSFASISSCLDRLNACLPSTYIRRGARATASVSDDEIGDVKVDASTRVCSARVRAGKDAKGGLQPTVREEKCTGAQRNRRSKEP